MLKSLILTMTFILTGCNNLSVFVADSLQKNDGDITEVTVNDDGQLNIQWAARNHDETSEYDIYMSKAESFQDALPALSIFDESASSKFTSFTSIKKSWKINPRLTGEVIGSVKGSRSFTYTGAVTTGQYYFFQVAPKGSPKAVLPAGGIVLVNLKPPRVSEILSNEESFLFTWPAVDGASEYLFYRAGDLANPVFTTSINSIAIRYDRIDEFQNLCVRSKRGELLSDDCSAVELELPSVPVASVDLDSAYSTTEGFSVSWKHWPSAKVIRHNVKTCRDRDCSESCSESQEITSLTTELKGSEGVPLYVCVQAVDQRGMSSRWLASSHSLTVDTIAPLVSVGADIITRTAVEIDASTSGAAAWSWSVVSGPSGTSGVEFGTPTSEDTRAVFATDGVYKLRLTATDAAGNNASADLNVTMDTTAPTFAGIAQVWRKSSTEAMVFWNPAVDLLSASSAITYELCVAAAGSNSCLTNFVVSQTPSSQTYNSLVSGLTPGSDYEFLIRARDAAGNINLGATPVSVRDLSGVADIAAGDRHTCAIVGSDRNLLCWGKNHVGQLGDNSTRSRVTPTLVPGMTGISKIALSDNHSCALKSSDGSVYCWGLNEHGQLGDGTIVNRLVPTLVPGLSGVIGIAVGTSHGCALLAAGSGVKCWGLNNYYQLGDTTNTQRLAPTPVTGLSGVVSIAAGGYNSCAIVAPDSKVMCWGLNSAGQLGDGTTAVRTGLVEVGNYNNVALTDVILEDVIHLSIGNRQLCAIQSTDNKARCWGRNDFGQLGTGNTTNQTTPVQVHASLPSVSKVFAGPDRTCATLLADNSVKCWGRNASGQLGDGTLVNSSLPVDAIGVVDSQALALGGHHSCSLAAGTETVRCFGNSTDGQLGRGNELTYPTPVEPFGLAAVASIVASDHFSCAIMSADRSVQCWGINQDGALGDGTTTNRSVPAPVTGLSGVSSIALGFYHGCALFPNGSMKCWGRNDSGQLGDGSTTRRLTPVDVLGLPAVRMIAASDWTTCALIASDDSVRCWGLNNNYHIGDGTNVNRTTPTPVVGLTGVDRIFGGTFQHCAIMKTNGSIKCWGENASGTLGDGTTAARSTPVSVLNLTGVNDLSMGIFHVCASMKSDGSLYCWGLNNHGQVGDGTTTNRSTPVLVPGISAATYVGGGEHHTCVVVGSEKRVKCWGMNTSGELGSGTYSDKSLVPVDVKGIAGVNWMGAGRAFNCVGLDTNGEVRCWGRNGNGEMGLGGRVFSDLTVGENLSLPGS